MVIIFLHLLSKQRKKRKRRKKWRWQNVFQKQQLMGLLVMGSSN